MAASISIIPDYIIENLELYHNSLIGRKLLMQYGEDQIINECANRGYQVKITVYTPIELAVIKRRTGKKSKYPVGNSYVLELI